MDIFSLFRPKQIKLLSKRWMKFEPTRSAVDVAHKIYGPNPADSQKHVIILHGLLGSKRNWQSLCTNITGLTKTTVIAADARNHGDSPHDSSHTYFDLAADLTQLQNKLSIKKSHVIGHSMGGRTGMVLALTEPSRVDSLIVVDVSPVPKIPNALHSVFPSLMAAMRNVRFEGADSTTKARTMASDSMIAAGVADNPAALFFILMNVGELPNKTFGWKCNVEALAANFENIARFPQELLGKQYPGPTLFIGGGKSDYLPRSDEPAIKQLFPTSNIVYIDHVGHNAHSEDPTAFLKIVADFYSQNLA